MRKLIIPLSTLHLPKLVRVRCFSRLPNILSTTLPPATPLLGTESIFSHSFTRGAHFLCFFPVRHFSSNADNATAATSVNGNPGKIGEDQKSIAELLSSELQKNPDAEPLPLPKRLDLSFSHITISPTLLLATLNISPDAGREALNFLIWAKLRPDFHPSDEVYSYFVGYFGRRKDFKVTHEVLVDGRGVAGIKSFEALVDLLVRAGRPTHTVALFERMEKDYGFVRNMDSLKLIVSSLCDRGYASYAEKMVKSLANEFSPDEYICDSLIYGWSVDGKLEEAKRLVDEMYRGGFEISTYTYNAILDCVCRLCRQKDLFRLQDEVQHVLIEMERNGVPRDVETFNVLITHLCKLRQTEEAMKLFSRMGIGIQAREIDRIFGLFPGILSLGVANRLKPLVDEFKALGFNLSEIRREVLREPKVLGLENGELWQCVEMLRKLKCRVAIKENIYRDGEFRAGYKVKLRVDCLRKHGLTYRDAFTVLWKEPRVILYEMDDIEKKIDFLVHKMKFDIQCLVEVPEYLGVNFEKQIVPRFDVIEHLCANDGLGDEVGLRDLVKLSRTKFYNMYVKPYPECEKLYGRFAGDVVVRSRHPTGMWKLFRPPKYPESTDDVKNMKAYVESLP